MKTKKRLLNPCEEGEWELEGKVKGARKGAFKGNVSAETLLELEASSH